jgi:hypothetical protein
MYIGAASEGVLLPAAKAAPILRAAQIWGGPWELGPDGVEITVDGKLYYILDGAGWGIVSATSPDGYHIVYAASPEEMKQKADNQAAATDPTGLKGALGGLMEPLNAILPVVYVGLGIWALSLFMNRQK